MGSPAQIHVGVSASWKYGDSCSHGWPGSVPWGAKWGLGTGDNLPVKVTGPWHEHVRWFSTVNQCSSQWNSCKPHQKTVCQRPQLHAEPHPQLPSSCFTLKCPTKADSHISMTAEVRELLSHAVLDTSSQELGTSTPKRPASVALGAPSTVTPEGDSSKLVTTPPQTSPQAVTPNGSKPLNQTPEAVCTPTGRAAVVVQGILVLPWLPSPKK